MLKKERGGFSIPIHSKPKNRKENLTNGKD